MKVILLQDVKNVGKKGEVKEVADGFGRNMLINKKLAVVATPKSMEILKQQQTDALQQAQQEEVDANKLKEKLEQLVLEFTLKAGKNGKTFGAVSVKQICAKLENDYNFKIDKRKFEKVKPVDTLGYTNLEVALHKNVHATLRVHITESK